MSLQQKIIIKLQVPCDKCSSKALALAAAADGVMSVALEGQDRDQVVVVGDGVDAACLTSSLRKKVGRVHLVSVEEVKEKAVNKDKEGKQNGGEKGKNGGGGGKENGGDAKKNGGENKNPPPCAWTVPPCHRPQLEFYNVVYDPYPPSCAVM
ncbi:hypothetical protein CJ030_MR0G027298 [Morella rubra]|uniref:HMA domain-containing protein n=1 Tax=Morella rubra TaxID=262757 RepID=A0A6A1UJ10_9ROSI|nr:hypothetical protein CJ030_MR0G027298 [Morella rubra]